MTGHTQRFGIPYPDSQTQAYRLGDELQQMAGGVEAALIAAGVPAVTNPDRAVCPTAAARDSHYGVPSTPAARLALQTRGAECIRLDTGYTERYYADYDASTNPGGAAPAGWYPIAGTVPHCSVLAVTTQTLAASAWTLIAAAWGQATSTMGTFSAGILTVDRPGLYDIELSIFIASLGSIQRIGCQVTKNSAVSDVGVIAKSLIGSQNTVSTFAREVPLVAGDRLRAFATGSSSDITLQPANAPSQLSVRYFAPPR